MSRGSITQRSPGSWTIQASGGFDDAGKRVRATRTVRGSRAEAERALTKLQRDVDDGLVATSGKTTVGKYLTDTWLPHASNRVRPTTYRRYEESVRLHTAPKIGGVSLAKLRPAHVQKVIDAMLADGAAPASALKVYRVLHAAFRQAVRWQVLAANPADAVQPPRIERAELHIPSAEETRTLIAAARGTTYEIPLLLAATTGARRGEVLGLRWSAVDLEAGVARITHTLQKFDGEAQFVAPKTDRSRRSVSLPSSTVERLRRHRKEQNERRLLLGAAWTDRDLVVDRGDGEHMDPDTFGHGFQRIAKEAGMGNVRLHDLRHAFATTLLGAGVHPKVVSEALGHASVAFTMDTYQHILPSMGGQVAAAIEVALGGQ